MVWCCLGLAVVSTLLSVLGPVLLGLYVLAGGLVALAVLRAVGPGEDWRIARSRGFDVVLLLALAAAVAYLASTPDL
ncbi:hypothetical protein EDD28_2040 [Salana multivorans]|uniref:DUF3017 family protein n=2 Tax=Salana multivorans TaxID=120377 RepID=A0A3N2DCB6_9MICO|nr:MAG: hypothetical protein BGO96_13010 [Micrococcales bacterium 73-15]ROR97441.1 hypothetical protein EDD28_2040 [Salana multivorans]